MMSSVQLLAYDGTVQKSRVDDVATEEPLQIRIAHGDAFDNLAVTMRTPGHDFELAAGFLLSEGIICSREQLLTIDRCVDRAIEAAERANIVNVTLAGTTPGRLLERHFTVGSSCGVCGSSHLQSLRERGVGAVKATLRVQAETLVGLPGRLREGQRVFASTGGLHAAALFDERRLVCVREDVGRHNAMDKLLGWALLNGRLPLDTCTALVSGRTSFEIVQKAAVGGISVLAGISAPTNLAVETAAAFNITLIGFLRGDRFNVYSVPERVI